MPRTPAMASVPRLLRLDPSLRAAGVLVLISALFFSVTITGAFLTVANAENILRQTSFSAIIAVGVMVVMVAGGIDISVGAVMSMAAALVMGVQPLGVPIAIAVALLYGLGVGLLNGLLVVGAGIVPFIATLGTLTMSFGFVHAYSNSKPIPGQVPGFGFLGGGDVGPFPTPFVVLTAVAVLAALVLTYTPFGRALYAVGGNAEAARLAGIPVGRVTIASYVISGGCAGLAGILIASQLNTSSTQLGIDTPLFILAAVIMGGASIFGGRGSALGALLGVLALTILANGLNGLGIQSAEQTIIRSIVFILVVVLDALSPSIPGWLRRWRALAPAPP
jgi:ribose transport system permease protein